MTAPQRTGRSRTAPAGVEIGLAIALVGVDALLTVIFSAVEFLNSMNVAGCSAGSGCNVDAAQAAILAMPIIGFVATAASAVAAVVTGFFTSRVWLPPLIALGVIIVTINGEPGPPVLSW